MGAQGPDAGRLTRRYSWSVGAPATCDACALCRGGPDDFRIPRLCGEWCHPERLPLRQRSDKRWRSPGHGRRRGRCTHVCRERGRWPGECWLRHGFRCPSAQAVLRGGSAAFLHLLGRSERRLLLRCLRRLISEGSCRLVGCEMAGLGIYPGWMILLRNPRLATPCSLYRLLHGLVARET